jgi:hypothetical protein
MHKILFGAYYLRSSLFVPKNTGKYRQKSMRTGGEKKYAKNLNFPCCHGGLTNTYVWGHGVGYKISRKRPLHIFAD